MKYAAHEYQKYAEEFIIEHPACGLMLDMGLGKTAITLTAIDELMFDYFDVAVSISPYATEDSIRMIHNRFLKTYKNASIGA